MPLETKQLQLCQCRRYKPNSYTAEKSRLQITFKYSDRTRGTASGRQFDAGVEGFQDESRLLSSGPVSSMSKRSAVGCWCWWVDTQCVYVCSVTLLGLVPLSIPAAYAAAAAYGGRSYPLASLPGYFIPGWSLWSGIVFLSTFCGPDH